jgi:hypothetical protein
MIKGKNDYYRHGDQNAICDVCGFKFKMSDLLTRWDGAMVDQACWEPRHPRDLPPPQRPEQPPLVSRPESTDTFTTVTYATTPVVPTGTFDGDPL